MEQVAYKSPMEQATHIKSMEQTAQIKLSSMEQAPHIQSFLINLICVSTVIWKLRHKVSVTVFGF
jgi:hypothetical protein